MAATTNKTFLSEPTGSSHLKKLVIDAPSAADGPKVIDIDALPPPPQEEELEVEEVEPSLADLMMGDALQNKAERAEKTAKDEKRMKKSFGDGMKKGLKKGFFDKPSKKKAPSKKKEADMPTITRKTSKNPSELLQGMKEEVAASMAQDRHPLAAALQGGEWVTPELVQELAKRPVLAKGMSNPRYQAALQALQKDPKNGAKQFDSDPELKRFLTEFCEVMGGHMIKLAGDEEAPKPSTPALPTDKEKAQMGPLCAQVSEACARGEGPEPAKTKQEQQEVDDVLKNDELRELLMDAKTQELMQRCADPRAFHELMRNPENRAIIAKLEKAGLVQLER